MPGGAGGARVESGRRWRQRVGANGRAAPIPGTGATDAVPVSGAWAATARSSWTSLEGKGLFVASADGSAAREIRSGPAASIAWSPSRDELALVCEHARSAVLVVGRDGTPIGRLDHAAEPAWLPDGSRLAYRRFRYDAAEPEYTAGEELHVASAAAVEQAQLTVPR